MTLGALGSIDAEMAEAVALGAEIRIGGEPVPLTPEPRLCRHQAGLNIDTTIGLVQSADDPSVVAGWQIRVRARCSECGCRFALDPSSARHERDDTALGVVVDASPE